MVHRFFVFAIFLTSLNVAAQKQNDVVTPLHALQPDYPIPYSVPTKESVKKVLDRVYTYLDGVTPMQFASSKTDQVFDKIDKPDTNIIFKQGDFRLTSYEWGVTYSGMLEAGLATGDKKFIDYTIQRVNFIGKVAQHYRSDVQKTKSSNLVS